MSKSWLRRRWGPVSGADLLLFAGLAVIVALMAWTVLQMSRQ